MASHVFPSCHVLSCILSSPSQLLACFPVFAVMCWFVCPSYLFLVFPSHLLTVLFEFVPYLTVPIKSPLRLNPCLSSAYSVTALASVSAV